ncbi:MAG: ribonuclease HIII [Kiritimatiellaeota bacterium]|nr:ribonuclease HIII [Kiritimatiellota bacterium]
MSANRTSFATKLTSEQITKLAFLLSETPFWESVDPPPYALWKARRPDVSVTAYESRKITVQGKGADDFITFTLEPEVTGVLGLEETSSADDFGIDARELRKPHAGIDESGKGDFFGPLVVAAVFVNEKTRDALAKIGVKDSKLIKSDKKISVIAQGIRNSVAGKFEVLAIGPEAYNRLYSKIGNLNELLAWGHARVLENLLAKVPECELALADKFAKESVTIRALMEKGRAVKLIQRTKGERDLAVAAASILARDEFVRRLRSLGTSFNVDLPKGASVAVEEAGRRMVEEHGEDILRSVSKTHFKTYSKIIDF